jgi:hypothetical protein
MPLVLAFDSQRTLLTCRVSGPITYADIQKHLDEERADRYLGKAELIDATGATVAFSGQELRGLVASLHRMSEQQPLGPTAVVVSSDVAYGMMRMLEMLVHGICQIRPFRTTAEAEAWLAEVAGPMVKN